MAKKTLKTAPAKTVSSAAADLAHYYATAEATISGVADPASLALYAATMMGVREQRMANMIAIAMNPGNFPVHVVNQAISEVSEYVSGGDGLFEEAPPEVVVEQVTDVVTPPADATVEEVIVVNVEDIPSPDPEVVAEEPVVEDAPDAPAE